MSMKDATGAASGVLYVVATPIGNLEDITLRALRILKEVRYIASEDTRHTRKLLSHFDIHTPQLSYYRERERERAAELVAMLQAGQSIAIVTDAGTPCISDPGAVLVEEARNAGVRVEVVPGPSSLTAALSIAGFSLSSFLYLGFAPSKKTQRRILFSSLATEKHHLVFFETPHRLADSLADCVKAFGEGRRAFVCRELTKLHEEGVSGTLAVIRTAFLNRETIKGEVVLVIEGMTEEAHPREEKDIDDLLRACRDEGAMSLKDAVGLVCEKLGVPRREVYRKALAVWAETETRGKKRR